jgi:hypothetical protein
VAQLRVACCVSLSSSCRAFTDVQTHTTRSGRAQSIGTLVMKVLVQTYGLLPQEDSQSHLLCMVCSMIGHRAHGHGHGSVAKIMIRFESCLG